MAKPSKSSVVIETISKHAATRGVVIHLDGDDSSTAAESGKKFLFESDGKILIIVISALSQEEKKAVTDIVLEYWDKHGLFLSTAQEEILENYQGYTEYNPYTDNLNLFTGKIPKIDLYALKMSFFMKVQSEKGHKLMK